jgi:NAD(P)-dependent dehydrogenase (short-subunit alcohol dehydrogenase family)
MTNKWSWAQVLSFGNSSLSVVKEKRSPEQSLSVVCSFVNPHRGQKNAKGAPRLPINHRSCPARNHEVEMADVSPSIALITGAGSGLGRALARLLGSAGWLIAGVDRVDDGLKTLEKELDAKGTRCAWAVADVTDAAALQRAVDTLETQLGAIDLLIASAGLGMETSALSLVPETFAAVVNVNLTGVANSVAAVLPSMLQRRRGHLAAISSLASYRGLPMMAAYCASKSGVNALMESLRVELAPHGIVTTTVCPSWVRTPMTAHLQQAIPHMLEVDEAARRIVKALRQRRKFVAFPAADAWRTRLLRWLPASVSDWLVGRMLRQLKRQ